MRERCYEQLTTVQPNMPELPASLVATATPSEITAECAAYATVQPLASYVGKFCSHADSVTTAQVGISYLHRTFEQ